MNYTKTYGRCGHVLVVSCPFQGHAAPLIKLSHNLTQFGITVTFFTTDPRHASMANTKNWNQHVRMVMIPDGQLHTDQENGDPKNHHDLRKLHQSVNKVMPSYLEDFLKKSKQSSGSDEHTRISGVIIDSPLGWMLEIPKKMGIKTSIFWCSSPGCMALLLKIPHLINHKFIDFHDGTLLKKDHKIELLPNMPAMADTDFTWHFPGDKEAQKEMFHFLKGITHHMRNADWILCNWIEQLDPSARSLLPNILSVGPLLARGEHNCTASFFQEDPTCLKWLDKQRAGSVVYVAFGSTSRFSQVQLEEVANALELMDRPFLWVAWSGLSLSDGIFSSFKNEFVERVGDRGKVVEWAPQEAVLGHPAVACFVTHCGWGSFMENLSMGSVPMVCWPYFGDQMYTQSCIRDAWKMGMSLKPNAKGFVSRNEIREKVEELLSDGIIRENAEKMKEMARKSIGEGGSSAANLEYFAHQMCFNQFN